MRLGFNYFPDHMLKRSADEDRIVNAPAPILRFLGAAGTVTGSKFLLTVGGHRVLVDCGLFQGLKQLRLMNWQPLPVDVHGIDAVLLTHAHLQMLPQA